MKQMKQVEYFGMLYLAEVTGAAELKVARAMQFFGGSGAASTEVLVRPCVLYFVKPAGNGVEPDGTKSGVYWISSEGRVFADSDFGVPEFEESAF